MLNGNLDLPPDAPIPGINRDMPYVLVGDAAFPLHRELMRPYPRKNKLSNRQKIFNYRLSRARRIVENAFGIMTQRFRIFNRRILLSPPMAVSVVKAAVILHNMLTMPCDRIYRQVVEMAEQDGHRMYAIRRRAQRPANEATLLRDSFAGYFSTAGQVPWQNALAHVRN